MTPGSGNNADVNGNGGRSRRIRRTIDGRGLRASIAADVNVVVSEGGGSLSLGQQVHVQQGRSVRTGPPSCQQKERTVSEQPGLSVEELDAASGEQLPDREQMSLVNANVAVPVNAAVAANVLSDDSVADADADQLSSIDQSN
jgi:hypothetical protein